MSSRFNLILILIGSINNISIFWEILVIKELLNLRISNQDFLWNTFNLLMWIQTLSC